MAEMAAPAPEINQESEKRDHLMVLAVLLSTRSPDSKRKVGSLLVNAKTLQLYGHGYNGMIKGAEADAFPMDTSESNELENKNNFIVHAEMNALVFSKRPDDAKLALIQTTYPCNECSPNIAVQKQIENIVFIDKQMTVGKASHSEDLLGGKCSKFRCKNRKYELNFKERSLNWTKEEVVTKKPQKTTFEVWPTMKRFSWDEFFLAVCIIEAQYAFLKQQDSTGNSGTTSNRKMQGSCIVKDNVIVGLSSHDTASGAAAIITAILMAGPAAKGAKLYTLDYPCNKCAQIIAQSGINQVLYLDGSEDKAVSEIIFDRRMSMEKPFSIRQIKPQENLWKVTFEYYGEKSPKGGQETTDAQKKSCYCGPSAPKRPRL